MTIHLTIYPPKNISKVVKLTHSWPMHLNINHLIFCNPGNVKGYLINLTLYFAKNILKVVKLTHPWPEHLNLFI